MNLIKGMLFSAMSLVAALGLRAATYYPVTIIYDPGEGKSIADFPVLVRIPVDSPIYAAAGTNGENLRFTDSLGVNDYPHEFLSVLLTAVRNFAKLCMLLLLQM